MQLKDFGQIPTLSLCTTAFFCYVKPINTQMEWVTTRLLPTAPYLLPLRSTDLDGAKDLVSSWQQNKPVHTSTFLYGEEYDKIQTNGFLMSKEHTLFHNIVNPYPPSDSTVISLSYMDGQYQHYMATHTMKGEKKKKKKFPRTLHNYTTWDLSQHPLVLGVF